MKKRISISTAPNSPLVVKNLKSLTEANRAVFHLEKTTTALCRCGQSQNKPFCDGTHGKIGWSSKKQEGRQQRRVDDYVGKTITIHDDRGICSHAGFCTEDLPKVFRMGVEPWIDADAENAATIIKTIKKCPSGALSFSVDGVLYDKFSDEPEIRITDAVALATASLIAIGCIQAKVCHTGTCPAGIATQNPQLRQLFDEERALTQFKNFYTATNSELKIFARTNGVNDVHKLTVSDLITDSRIVADFTDIPHV